MKICSVCNIEKEFKNFNKFVRSKDGYRSDNLQPLCSHINRDIKRDSI